MVDCAAIRRTIARESNLEHLRDIIVELLGAAEQRLQTLSGLDPGAKPGFSREEAERMRGRLRHTRDIELMRVLARDACKGVELLDVQIALARSS